MDGEQVDGGDPEFAPLDMDDDSGIAEGVFGSAEGSNVELDDIGADMRDSVNSGDQGADFTVDPIFEQLNPASPNGDFGMGLGGASSSPKKAVHFLDVEGVKQHKASYIPQYLESTNAWKTTTRPLRTWGVTVADAIRQRHNTEATNRPESTEDDIRAGDLGAILTRTGDRICLGVAEVLNFKKGTSAEVGEITFNELEKSDQLSLSVAIQLLQLEVLPSHISRESNQPDFTWISTGEYVQLTKAGNDSAISKKHVVIRIPGEIFHPLGPTIYWKDDNPFWALSNASLAEIMVHAWNELNLESDEIISNINLLPEVLETPDLPYRIDQNNLSSLIINGANLPFNIQTSRSDPGVIVPCYLCPRSLKLRDMRNHVGKHILKALRDCRDTLNEGIVVRTYQF